MNKARARTAAGAEKGKKPSILGRTVIIRERFSRRVLPVFKPAALFQGPKPSRLPNGIRGSGGLLQNEKATGGASPVAFGGLAKSWLVSETRLPPKLVDQLEATLRYPIT